MGYRRYEKQFKEQTLKLVTEQGRAATTVARDLGIPHTTLLKWLKKIGWKPAKMDRANRLPDDPAALKARICQLEGQVKELEIDREILKKATAFFASQSK